MFRGTFRELACKSWQDATQLERRLTQDAWMSATGWIWIWIFCDSLEQEYGPPSSRPIEAVQAQLIAGFAWKAFSARFTTTTVPHDRQKRKSFTFCLGVLFERLTEKDSTTSKGILTRIGSSHHAYPDRSCWQLAKAYGYGLFSRETQQADRIAALQDAYAAYDKGEISRDEFVKAQDKAVQDSLTKMAATGEPLITDGEQRLSS